MHCRDQGFPSQPEQSDLDIALPAGTGDAEYLEASLMACGDDGSWLPARRGEGGLPPAASNACPVCAPARAYPAAPYPLNTPPSLPHSSIHTHAYKQILEATLPRLLAEQAPDLVMYNAGADVSASDALGKLALSDAAIAARDRFVMRACADAGAPVAAAIGGGYGKDRAALVERHVSLHRAAAEFFPALAAACQQRRLARQEERRRQRAAAAAAG